MRGATDDNASTQTVDSSNNKERRGARTRWSHAAGGGWQKGARRQGNEEVGQVKARWSYNAGSARNLVPDGLEDDDDEEENETWTPALNTKQSDAPWMAEEEGSKAKAKARWSFNAGAARNLMPDDDDEEEDEENDMWTPKTQKAAVPMIEEEDVSNAKLSPVLDKDDTEETEEFSFGESSPLTPPKPVKESLGSPKSRYIPNPVIPKIPTETKKQDDEDIPPPKRMHMELCGEVCEREFKQMSLEAISPRSSLRKKLDSSSQLTLSAPNHNRPSVRERVRRDSTKRLERRSSIQNSLRNLNF